MGMVCTLLEMPPIPHNYDILQQMQMATAICTLLVFWWVNMRLDDRG